MNKVIETIASEVEVLVSESRSKGGPKLGEIVELLAGWAHLQRLDPAQLPEGCLKKATEALEAIPGDMLQIATLKMGTSCWRMKLAWLAKLTDDRRANISEARKLMDDLDRFDLAFWASKRFYGRRQEEMEELEGRLFDCLFAFEAEIDVFKDLNDYAKMFREACRDNLLAFDSQLWGTVVKFDMVADYAAIVASITPSFKLQGGARD